MFGLILSGFITIDKGQPTVSKVKYIFSQKNEQSIHLHPLSLLIIRYVVFPLIPISLINDRGNLDKHSS